MTQFGPIPIQPPEPLPERAFLIMDDGRPHLRLHFKDGPRDYRPRDKLPHGWTAAEVVSRWLEKLYEIIPDGEPCPDIDAAEKFLGTKKKRARSR